MRPAHVAHWDRARKGSFLKPLLMSQLMANECGLDTSSLSLTLQPRRARHAKASRQIALTIRAHQSSVEQFRLQRVVIVSGKPNARNRVRSRSPIDSAGSPSSKQTLHFLAKNDTPTDTHRPDCRTKTDNGFPKFREYLAINTLFPRSPVTKHPLSMPLHFSLPVSHPIPAEPHNNGFVPREGPQAGLPRKDGR